MSTLNALTKLYDFIWLSCKIIQGLTCKIMVAFTLEPHLVISNNVALVTDRLTSTVVAHLRSQVQNPVWPHTFVSPSADSRWAVVSD